MALAMIMLMGAFIKICSLHTPTNNPNMPKHKEFPGKQAGFMTQGFHIIDTVVISLTIIFRQRKCQFLSGLTAILSKIRIPSWGGTFIRPGRPIEMILFRVRNCHFHRTIFTCSKFLTPGSVSTCPGDRNRHITPNEHAEETKGKSSWVFQTFHIVIDKCVP